MRPKTRARTSQFASSAPQAAASHQFEHDARALREGEWPELRRRGHCSARRSRVPFDCLGTRRWRRSHCGSYLDFARFDLAPGQPGFRQRGSVQHGVVERRLGRGITNDPTGLAAARACPPWRATVMRCRSRGGARGCQEAAVLGGRGASPVEPIGPGRLDYQPRQDRRDRKTPCPQLVVQVRPLIRDVQVNAAKRHVDPYASRRYAGKFRFEL